MEFTTVLFVSICLLSSMVNALTGCSNISAFPDDLETHSSLYARARDLDECAKVCRAISGCRGFYFYNQYHLCWNLNYQKTSLGNVWNTGPCYMHSCAEDETCFPAGNRYICKKSANVCFHQLRGKFCFKWNEKLYKYMDDPDAILGSNPARTPIECLTFCNKYHPTYTAFLFDTKNFSCVCQGDHWYYWTMDGSIDSYFKIN